MESETVVADTHINIENAYELKLLTENDIEKLPYEKKMSIPDNIVISFDKLDGVNNELEEKDVSEGDVFNDMGLGIKYDDTNIVRNLTTDLVRKFNDYDYSDSVGGKIVGGCMTVSTCGCWVAKRTKVVKPGNYGHAIVSGKHILYLPGRHRLISSAISWKGEIPIDDEHNLKRTLGSRTILRVPENHIAGAYRVGVRNEGDVDGEYVIFKQGTHVLEESHYRQIECKSLVNQNLVKIGPLSIVYVRDNFIACANVKNEGRYMLFYPGRPYILHEKDYENVQIVVRTLNTFVLGPYTFVTVKDGQIGGAFEKHGGKYQLLYPGNTYMLHEKKYSDIKVVNKQKMFLIGTYYFVTVQDGYIAGAYKRKGGEFIILPAGYTYQLNVNEYYEPMTSKKDSHVVKCGPLTFLTVEKGKLAGAYRVKNGVFVEFEESDEAYVLHEKEYHDLTIINKYQYTVQNFGPNKVITIRENYKGVFEKEGSLEFKDSGFYKVSNSYEILDSIPLKSFINNSSNIFSAKDQITMGVAYGYSWKVIEPRLIVKYPGTFENIMRLVSTKVENIIQTICRQYKRCELLPSESDVYLQEDANIKKIKETEQSLSEITNKLYSDISVKCKQLISEILTNVELGIELTYIKIDGFEIKDEKIKRDLEAITQSVIAKRTAQFQGELAVERARSVKREAQEKAEAEAMLSVKKAEAQTQVDQLRAVKENDIEVMKRTAGARADLEATKIEEQRRKILLEIELEEKKRRADIDSGAIKKMAEAKRFEEESKFAARKEMPKQEVDLKMMELQVQMAKELGHSAWAYPTHIEQFVRNLLPTMRLAPTANGLDVVKMQEELTELRQKLSGENVEKIVMKK
jgi:regulator of protease activity HflC (stomatin/prohibitin superfamily)